MSIKKFNFSKKLIVTVILIFILFLCVKMELIPDGSISNNASIVYAEETYQVRMVSPVKEWDYYEKNEQYQSDNRWTSPDGINIYTRLGDDVGVYATRKRNSYRKW